MQDLEKKLLNRKQKFQDKIICKLIKGYNDIYEPYKLNIERQEKSKKYQTLKEPLVSVITTTYNRGKILKERAIDSVLSQTYKNFEYIIIGDCCTDDTETIVKKINDKRIKFFNLPVRKKRYPYLNEYAANHWYVGSSVGANKALSKSSGEWIARLDDWAIWTDKNLEIMVKNSIERREIEFFTGSTLYNDKKTEGNMALGSYFRLNKNINNQNAMIGPTQTFFYRSYLKFFKYSLHSWRKKWNKNNDLDLVTRMFCAGVRFGWVDDILAIIKPRPGLSSVNSKGFLESITKNNKLYNFEK